MKHLVREKWDFKVKQIHLQEYLVVFPDKSSLETFTRLSEFQMSLFGLKGKLEKTARELDTSSLLQSIWVKIHGVPDLARDVDSVKEIAGLVIEPLVVDELSPIKEEPIRVQGRCRNPRAIRGSIEVFFNGVGKLIRFEVEGGSHELSKEGKGLPLGLSNMMINMIKTITSRTKKSILKRPWGNLIDQGKLIKRWMLAMMIQWKRGWIRYGRGMGIPSLLLLSRHFTLRLA